MQGSTAMRATMPPAPRSSPGRTRSVSRSISTASIATSCPVRYDTSGITALLATRVIIDVLGTLVSHGKMAAHKAFIDKPVSIPARPDHAHHGAGHNHAHDEIEHFRSHLLGRSNP